MKQSPLETSLGEVFLEQAVEVVRGRFEKMTGHGCVRTLVGTKGALCSLPGRLTSTPSSYLTCLLSQFRGSGCFVES